MENNNLNLTSSRIKQMRLDRGWTQKDLAKRLGLKNDTAIANYEAGYSTPKDEIKLKMCELFGCSMDYLMGKNEYQDGDIFDKALLDSYNIDECVEKSFNTLVNLNLSLQRIKLIINNFNYYCRYIINQLDLYSKGLYMSENKSISNFTDAENNYYFLIFHKGIINVLINAGTLTVNQANTQTNDIFLLNNPNYQINHFGVKKIIKLIILFVNSLNTFYRYYDNRGDELSSNHSIFYMAPVYGRIAAGQPNWAEECIEGRIPIDPDYMHIVNPEECFFLKVNGESMNKEIKNGAYALIRKTDIVENGDIAVVLVNGFDATLKKFSKQGDLVILEPMSNDPSFTTQVYGKDTEIKIIGKYLGKMEMK